MNLEMHTAARIGLILNVMVTAGLFGFGVFVFVLTGGNIFRARDFGISGL
jgi:hypothetical protein